MSQPDWLAIARYNHHIKDRRNRANEFSITTAKGFGLIFGAGPIKFLPYPAELDPLEKIKLRIKPVTAQIFCKLMDADKIPPRIQGMMANSKQGNLIKAMREVANESSQ
jgi:hypothetical protein